MSGQQEADEQGLLIRLPNFHEDQLATISPSKINFLSTMHSGHRTAT
jgi:hypothetical protein